MIEIDESQAVSEADTTSPGAEVSAPPAVSVLTDAEWERVLSGRRMRWLPEQVDWAGARARSCGGCANTKMHGDPRRGWCTAHRFMVSMAFTVLCREYRSA
jgi:hypothetical protein